MIEHRSATIEHFDCSCQGERTVKASLGRLGHVTTEWRAPTEGRRRKYYVITDEGRTALADHQRQWAAVTRALEGVWAGSAALLTARGQA